MNYNPHTCSIESSTRYFVRFVTSALPIVAFLCLMIPNVASALHTPLDWYEPATNDLNFNKLDDRLDLLPSDSMPEVFICFKFDCRPDSLMSELLSMGAELGYLSPIISSAVIRGISVSDLQSIVAAWDSVGWITPNSPVELHMTTSGQSVAAHAGFYSPNTAQDQGSITGAGVTIAIFDTGVRDLGNGGHPDLPIALGGIFVINPFTGALGFGNPTDNNGHGTQVAGIALGRGGIGGANRGVASGANLFDCRVSDPGGTLSLVGIQAAVDWVTLNGASVSPPIRVANMSIGTQNAATPGGPIAASINAMVVSGVVMCVSAGNHDNCPTTPAGNPAGIGEIAVSRRAITVASASDQRTATRADDVISGFSRVGPGLGADRKPNITAYGAQCTPNCPAAPACASPVTNTVVCANRFGGYSGFSGTSCASPMVAGACALLLEMNPALTPAAIKNTLLTNAEDRGTPGWDRVWGSGLLDLRTIFSAPPVNCDLAVTKVDYTPRPVDCNLPVTVTVTVTNTGGVSVTNFIVNIQYWYLTAGSPPVRYDLIPVPLQNTAGPLAPGASRDFTATVNLKLLTTPLSQHTCFWGIVGALCDNVPGNNEKNVNATIQGLQGTQCDPFSPPIAGGDSLGDTMVVPVRLAHRVGFGIPVTVIGNNPDTANWDVFMEFQGMTGNILELIVDHSECPVAVNVCAYAKNPEISDSIDVIIFSFNELHGNFGDATITFLARDLNVERCNVPGDANNSGSVNIADVTFLIARIFAGGAAPPSCEEGDANGSGSVNIADVTFLIARIFAGGAPPICGPAGMACMPQ